jgi:cytochrome b561
MKGAVYGREPGYSGMMRALHWATAVLLLGAYVAAWSIEDAADRAEATRLTMLHRSMGLTVLVLTVLRIAWRQRSTAPRLPADMPAAQRFAARVTVMVLYGLLVAQPLIGLAASMLDGDRILVWGSFLVPNSLPVNRGIAGAVFRLHEWCALALLALIGLHGTAALYHHFIRRDAVLAGMVPGLRPRAQRRSADLAETSR